MFAIKYDDDRGLFLMNASLGAFTANREDALTFPTQDAAAAVWKRLPAVCAAMCDVVALTAYRAETGEGG